MLPDQLANSGWTAERWDQLEAHARETVNRHAGLRHVIPRAPDMPGAYVVNVISKGAGPALSLQITSAVAPTKIEVPFSLEGEQVGDFDVALRLVERAARTLAQKEDAGLYFGEGGLLSAAGKHAEASNVGSCVALGRDKLSQGTIPYRGPYCLAAEPRFWTEMIVPQPSNPAGVFPIVQALLGDGARIVSVPSGANEGSDGRRGRAVLFSIDSFAIDLVFVEQPTIAWLGVENGSLKLALQERFKLRVIDGDALSELKLVGG